MIIMRLREAIEVLRDGLSGRKALVLLFLAKNRAREEAANLPTDDVIEIQPAYYDF